MPKRQKHKKNPGWPPLILLGIMKWTFCPKLLGSVDLTLCSTVQEKKIATSGSSAHSWASSCSGTSFRILASSRSTSPALAEGLFFFPLPLDFPLLLFFTSGEAWDLDGWASVVRRFAFGCSFFGSWLALPEREGCWRPSRVRS